eukprot:c472_g1_i1 orf=403-1062(+)
MPVVRSGNGASSISETRHLTPTSRTGFTEATVRSYSSGRESTMANYCESFEDSRDPKQKRVMVVVDKSRESRLALFWALSHVVHDSDIITLLHVLPAQKDSSPYTQGKPPKPTTCKLTNSFKVLVSTHRPEVQIQVLVVEGPKGQTIVGEARKLDTSILVLGQRKPSLIRRLFCQTSDGFVDYCIHNTECLTLAVRRKSRWIGGYLINSRWQRNFWLLA